MYQYMQFLTKKWRQQGAIIAFTALLLPMIIVGVGLAVDLGNIYVQYSRLQNAADAAALAGATTYAEKNEKIDNHPNADAKAEKYIQGEFHNLKDEQKEQIEDNYKKGKKNRYKARTKDNVTYYRVKLYKEVPLYFLGSIYKKIYNTDKDTFTVPVEAFAPVPPKENGNYFNNKMFIYSEAFEGLNSADNEGALDDTFEKQSTGVIADTYDGEIVYTSDTAKDATQYSTGTAKKKHPFDRFYTYEARKLNKDTPLSNKVFSSPEQEVNFGNDGKVQSGYWTKIHSMQYDYNRFIDHMKDLTERHVNAPKEEDKTLILDGMNANVSENTLKGKKYIWVKGCSYFNMNINASLGDEKDGPVYIYVENKVTGSNININADTGRPIILCINGDENNRSELNVGISGGKTFKGVFYVPWTVQNGLMFNAADAIFKGTIVASKINLRGHRTRYIYENYMDDNDGGNTGSGKSTTGRTYLVNAPEGIVWGD